METPLNILETLVGKVENYIKTSFELTKLKLLESTITIVASLFSRLCILISILVCIFIFSIGLAQYLGEILGKSYYGFFVVSGAYLLVGLILFFPLHKWIKKTISKIIIKKLIQ
ncbi:MAG: hypothetical protein NTZ33_07060 [Bacteroidetes bacterium]|nr:hypothetical protein [Bacteroidota bacterium]